VARISVVIPAYNEAERIQVCLDETVRVLQGLDYEIISVDDGSQDDTYEKMLFVAASNPRIRPIRQPANQGKGGALMTGSRQATGDLVAFLDADLELPPSQLLTFIQLMRETEADIVIGSKSHPESQLEYPWFRRITSIVYYQLIRFLFGLALHDTQTGLKLFQGYALRRIIPRLQVRRFAFDLELLVAASRFGYTIKEAPVVVSFQRGNTGRIGGQAIAHMLLDTLQIFYQASFWKWLEPGLKVRLWMTVLVLSLILFSFGLAHWLTLYIPIPPQLSGFAYLITLRFVNKEVRDWIMMVVGFAFVIGSLIELNKSLMAAFARADKGDLAGIIRRQHQNIGDIEKGDS